MTTKVKKPAKSTATVAEIHNLKPGLQTLDYGRICWFHDENSRAESFGNPLADLDFNPSDDKNRNKELPKGGLVNLLRRGWDSSQGAVKVEAIADAARVRGVDVAELLARCESERKRQIAVWESNEATKVVALTARKVWFPDGVMVVPYAIGEESYRRSEAIMGVLAMRERDPQLANDLSFALSVCVVSFASMLERNVSHIQENTLKDAGRMEYGPLDYLRQAVMISQSYGRESDLVRAGVKRGTAQKVFAIAELDKKFPQLKIVERCFSPAPADGVVSEYDPSGYIPLSKLDKEEARRLLNGFAYHDKGQTTAIAVDDATIHDWLSTVVTGRVARPRGMSATEIGTLKNSPVKLLQIIATAIVGNDKQFFMTLDKLADELNTATEGVVKKLARRGVNVNPNKVDKQE